jgi:hypothetical protein
MAGQTDVVYEVEAVVVHLPCVGNQLHSLFARHLDEEGGDLSVPATALEFGDAVAPRPQRGGYLTYLAREGR